MINLVGIGFRYFERPYVLLVILPLIFMLVYLIRKDIVKLSLGQEYEKRRKKLRIFVFVTRLIIFLLLLIALASPFIETTKIISGDPKVKILVDNSTSMDIFDLSFVNNFKKELEKRIPIEISFIASGEESRLGDEILTNMRRDDNLLLITDGNNNKGIELGDAALQANIINASMSALRIFPDRYDASVVVYGSDKTTSKAENTFTVFIKKTENRTVHLIVDVDDVNVVDKNTNEEQITFKKTFDSGYHRIVARLDVKDYFNQNNIFYKTVKVVPKPKVLLLGNGTEIIQLFDPLYDMKRADDLNLDLKPYTAVIVDNKDADDINNYSDALSQYVSDGNGLFVIGGRNSYDFGSYNGSRFEQLLPVFVAKAGRKRGDVNIVFVVDISGSTGKGFGGYTKVDVEKALTISMLKNVSLVNNVGLVAFNTRAYVVSEIKKLIDQTDLEDKISRLIFGGGTDMTQGIKASIDMLQNMGGSKNIIILSDGETQDREGSADAVRYATSQGINVYTVGVGGDTNTEFMTQLASIGNGIYFEPDTSQQIKLLFGETEVSGNKRVFPLIAIDKNHFITRGLELTAKIYGFNQVVPKTTAKLLVTTDVGDPIVSVWRFGLGRVASLSTDYNVYGFELLNKDNSILLTRITNWIIGDPERKNAKFIDIADGRLGEAVDVVVKSDVQPSSDQVALYKYEENLYRGTMFVNTTGFSRVMNAVFAVNYRKEYQDIGVNPELSNIVFSTGGSIFDPNNVDGIVEFIKQKSRREILTRKSYSWIFLLSALILYLIEVCIRRLITHKII